MRIIALFLLVVALGESSGCATNKREENKMPKEAAVALHASGDITLFSLQPWGAATNDVTLHGYKILGQTELAGDQARIAVEAFESAVCKKRRKYTALCFDPRHAIRVRDSGQTYDFLLCYACGYLYIYRDNELISELDAGGSPKVLNDLLVAAKIPLSQSGE
jgi:hypothetical protein